jgi:tRNA pseudouridine55 synthase
VPRKSIKKPDVAVVHGVLLVDKPEGITSAEVVRRIKRKVGGKVGHLGTLDPFATGLLPLCLGEGTKIAQFLNAADKTYEGTICLGVATDTADRTGEVREQRAVPEFTNADLRRVAEGLAGASMQTPPMYSAIKREGVPLYKLAREGIEVERAARPITIHELSLDRVDDSRIRFHVACSKGTYVRVLAEDIGRELGTVAHLAELRRITFGAFRIDQGVVDADSWDPGAPAGLLSIREALGDLPTVVLPERCQTAVRRGQAWVLNELAPDPPTSPRALLVAASGDPLAVVEQSSDGTWRFARVLNV